MLSQESGMPMVLKATLPYSENLCIPNFGMEYSFGPEINMGKKLLEWLSGWWFQPL